MNCLAVSHHDKRGRMCAHRMIVEWSEEREREGGRKRSSVPRLITECSVAEERREEEGRWGDEMRQEGMKLS